MKAKQTEKKITVRLYPDDPRQQRALEILQTQSAQLGKSYGETITDAILNTFDTARLTDDALVDKFAERVREMLQELAVTAPQTGPVEKKEDSAAEGINYDDIPWDFLEG